MSRLIALFCILMLSACAGTGSRDSASLLVGSWESNLAGFSVSTTYSDGIVTVEGQNPQPYLLDDNLLVVNGDRTTARRITFTGRNEMQQTDVITGTVHTYRRTPE